MDESMTLEHGLQLAGILQLAIASANLVAIRMFRYRQGLAAAPEVIRQVFWVQNVFLVLVLVGFSLLCLLLPTELTGGDVLGRAVCGFLAIFWLLRLIAQFAWYSPEKRRQYWTLNAVFVAAFVYLVGIFAFALSTR
jgi:hypothetical protein